MIRPAALCRTLKRALWSCSPLRFPSWGRRGVNSTAWSNKRVAGLPRGMALSWEALKAYTLPEPDRVHGPTNAQSKLRLFGHTEEEVRVTLYRDNHAWCPYCQKIWLWLEESQIPYRWVVHRHRHREEVASSRELEPL